MKDDVKKEIGSALVRWFGENQRELPWRSRPEPYRVWVSEIMLQQTRVSTVIPYYESWMKRFPTLQSLSDADMDDVLGQWAGLGYYRRARLLHKGARFVVEELGGEIPGDVRGLLKVPGIGRYTAGAIASIAFQRDAPIVDGNVIRVLCRIFGIDGEARSTPVQKRLWALAEELIPSGEARDFNQSMMELGALVCSPKSPSCGSCPVLFACEAKKQGRVHELPVLKKAKKQKPVLVASAWVRRVRGGRSEYLLVQRPMEGLFGGLWEAPTVDMGVLPSAPDAARLSWEALKGRLESLGVKAALREVPGSSVVHLLTHLKMTILPFEGECVEVFQEVEGVRWVTLEEIDGVALSTAMKKVVKSRTAQGVLF